MVIDHGVNKRRADQRPAVCVSRFPRRGRPVSIWDPVRPGGSILHARLAYRGISFDPPVRSRPGTVERFRGLRHRPTVVDDQPRHSKSLARSPLTQLWECGGGRIPPLEGGAREPVTHLAAQLSEPRTRLMLRRLSSSRPTVCHSALTPQLIPGPAGARRLGRSADESLPQTDQTTVPPPGWPLQPINFDNQEMLSA